jgi:hypothetical protein
MLNAPTESINAVPDLTSNTDAYQITPTGIAFFRDIDKREWEALGGKLGQAGRSIAWLIGDWLAYGDGKGDWGDTYTEAMRITGLEYHTLRIYAQVSRRVQFDVRTSELSWEHHRKIAPLKDPHDQKKWIKAAESAAKKGKPVSTRRLAKSIIVGKLVEEEDLQTPPAERGKDNANTHVNHLVIWWGNMKRAGWLKNAQPYQLRDLLLDLHPVLEIAQELRTRLAELPPEDEEEEAYYDVEEAEEA